MQPRAAVAARRLACWVGLAVGLPSVEWAATDSPAANLVVVRPESDLLLLALKLDRSILAETLPVFQDRGGVLVPFGEVCRLLGLGITVDLARGVGSGFFLDERRIFSLDVVAQKVIVEGQAKRFDSDQIEVHLDDIYVDAALLSEWLPLHLSVDLFASTITVHPEEKLPLELRLERERKLQALRASARTEGTSSPRLKLRYQLFDGPFIDQTLRYVRQPGLSGEGRNQIEYSTYATGDALFMEGSAFVSGSQDRVSDARVSLSRKDPQGLGLFGAREVAVGEVFHPGLELIAAPRSGPGFLISNFPLQLQTQFDRQSFRGNLPPGWEAELYRGAELLDYAQSRPDGLYEFLDVPLLFGQNVFRVDLYGPQGQRRSEISRFNVGDTLTPKGRVYYRIAGNRPDVNWVGTSLVTAKERASFDLSAGLTKNLSGSLSLATVDLPDRRHRYGKAALRGYWGFAFTNVEIAADAAGGSAWQATMQSRLGGWGLEIQHAQLDDFVSERFISSSLAPLSSRTRLRLDSAIPETWLPRIPWLLEIRQDRLASGEWMRQVTFRASMFRRGFAIANQMLFNAFVRENSTAADTASGQVLISKIFQGYALRGTIDYELRPERELTNVALTGEKRLGRSLLVTGGISRVNRTGQTRWLAGMSRLEGAFGLGLTANYSEQEGLGLGTLFSMSVSRDSRNGEWDSQARPLAGFGALSGRAFLDANGNGLMDSGEEPIVGAGFLLNGTGPPARTNDAGEAFLTHLAPYQDLDLALAASTLEDPFWKPEREAVRILPRPGKVAVVDFPVLITGEVSGTIYLKRDGETKELSGVELELVDRQGVIAKKVRTGFDGFYDITDVRPGGYTLSVSAEHVVRLNLEAPSRDVKFLAQGTVFDGFDFMLVPAALVGRTATSTPRNLPADLPSIPSSPVVRPSSIEPAPRSPAIPLWALQVQSLRDAAMAEREARRLSVELAHPTRVVDVDLGHLGRWHRVYLIGFGTAAEASSERLRLAARGVSALRPVLLLR